MLNLEIIKKKSLSYHDINSKFVKNIIHKFNNEPINNGITIILFNKEINNNFKLSKNVKVISVINDQNKFLKLINNNFNKEVLYLFDDNENISSHMKLAFNFINTTHFMIVDKIEDISFNDFNHLDSKVTYVLNRENIHFANSIINHMFLEADKEIFNNKNIIVDEVVKKNHDIDKYDNMEHPLLIQLETHVNAENIVQNEDKSLEYSIENHLLKLYTYKGILFPVKSFENINFTNSFEKDSFLIALTEFILINDIKIMQLNELIFLGKDNLNFDLKNIQSTLIELNSILDKRVSEEAVRFVQLIVDQILLSFIFILKGDKEKIKNKINKLEKLQLNNLSLEVLNKGNANELVIAYCFPPYNDTSGNVMAKRIFVENNKVDIISNNMDRIRKKDFSLNGIANEFIDTKFLLTAPQAFSSYQSISEFTEQGFEIYNLHREKYTRLYSRAMFPASHFLAYEIKNDNKSLYWRAEFSDPLLTDVSSNKRYSPIKDKNYLEKIKKEINPDYLYLIDDNVFNLCEILPLSIADELIFTNEHQLEYIIQRFSEDIKSSIRERAVISEHPTLPKEYYNKDISYYNLDDSRINLAYFGNFYDTRGFREIELFCKYIKINNINNFMIHVFTNINENVIKMVENSQFREHIILNPYLDYFEFLNLTNKMDVLMIYDAHTIGIKEINPYLPSKLSDYIGSNALTLAFVEENSVLSKIDHSNLIKVNMNEFSKYHEVIKNIAKKLHKSL